MNSDLTKQELSTLNKLLRLKPELIKPASITDNLSDNSDSESEYLSHTKVISVDTVKIDKLEEQKYYQTLELSNLNIEIEELTKKLEEFKIKNEKNIYYQKYIKLAIEFLNSNFTLEDVQLNTRDTQSMIIFKKKMLEKARDFSILETKYDILINYWTYETDLILTTRKYFEPVIIAKYKKIHDSFNTSNNDNTNIIIILLTVFVFIISLFISQLMLYLF